MAIVPKLIRFAVSSLKLFHIDESHGLSHALNVLHHSHNILQSELPKNPFLEHQRNIIYTSALLHDICDKKYIKPEGRETKYCSRTCQMLAQSSGLAEIPSNGRQGFRKDLSPNYFFKSSLEADYARWCEFTGRKYIYEHKTFTVQYDGRDKQYTPDFYHPDEDKYVELKAIRRDRKFNSNLLAADLLKQDGIDIDVLLMDEFYRNIKQSGHYWLIDNIENKNYHGTRHLIYLKKKVV